MNRIPRKIALSITFGIMLLASSCTKPIYIYNGVRYDSAEQVHVAQREDGQRLLGNIVPTSSSVKGSAIVVLPSISYIKNNYILWKGAPPSEEVSNYIATSVYNQMQIRAECIKLRRIFDRTSVIDSDSPENSASNEDYAIISMKGADGKGGWGFRKKGSSSTVEIEMPSSSLPPLTIINIWLENIEKMAKTQ
jgi:hypothetical protein